MRYTNKHNLPGELVTAVYDNQYTNGGADISVTSLIDAPRRFVMKAEYGDVVEKDVADEIWPILGTAFHKIMEENTGPEVVTEERLFSEWNGWTLSGQLDRQVEENGRTIIQDFKVTSVYTVMAWRSEWTEQLNVYRWLYWKTHGVWPDAEIIALMRDWRRTESLRNPQYPEQPIVKRPVRSMAPDEIEKLIDARMTLHQAAKLQYEEFGHIVDCSAEERWREPDRFAVMKKGAKRATRVLDDEEQAKKMAKMHGLTVEKREGGERRCEGYCEFSKVCTQYHRIKQDKAVQQFKGWINADAKKKGERLWPQQGRKPGILPSKMSDSHMYAAKARVRGKMSRRLQEAVKVVKYLRYAGKTEEADLLYDALCETDPDDMGRYFYPAFDDLLIENLRREVTGKRVGDHQSGLSFFGQAQVITATNGLLTASTANYLKNSSGGQ